MSLNSKYNEIDEKFFLFKSKFQKQQNLLRIFLHEWTNMCEEEMYIMQDENISRNCLYTMGQLLEEMVEENVKSVEKLYFEFQQL